MGPRSHHPSLGFSVSSLGLLFLFSLLPGVTCSKPALPLWALLLFSSSPNLPAHPISLYSCAGNKRSIWVAWRTEVLKRVQETCLAGVGAVMEKPGGGGGADHEGH